MGSVLGEDGFVKSAKKKFDRRKKQRKSLKRRKFEYDIEPVENVLENFEREKGIKIKEINTELREGKALRNELLVLLKENAGLTYSEIIKFPLFNELKYSSLGKLYKRTKKRRRE